MFETNEYPYTDFHEMNLDWVIKQIRKLHVEWSEFKILNSIRFDGPWDITKQYPAWTLVNNNNLGYISKKPVPAGIALDNTEYWGLVADYSALLADMQNRIIALENKEYYYVTPEQFGAVGDGITDDTEAIQKAIDHISSTGGIVQFYPKIYVVDSLYIENHNISLKGCKSNVNSSYGHGTVLLSKPGATDPMINVVSNSTMIGGALSDISLMAYNRQSYDHAVDRIALKILNRAEFNLTNVFIGEFKNGGVYAQDWWDSTITSLEIRACGTSDGKAALYIGSENDSSNSLHFFGLHIEECPYQLHIDNVSSHIQFVGCKFEDGNAHLTYTSNNENAIFIYEGVYNVTFDSCFFSNGSFVRCLYAKNNNTIISNCTFARAGNEYIRNQSNNVNYGKGIIITGCMFEAVVNNSDNFINIGDRSIFSNNKLLMSTDCKPLLIRGNFNVISDNVFASDSSSTEACIKCLAANNKINGNAYNNRYAYEGTVNNETDNKKGSFAIISSSDYVTDFNANVYYNILANTNYTFDSSKYLNVHDDTEISLIRNSGYVSIAAEIMIDNTRIDLNPKECVTIKYVSQLSKWVRL